jgi:hypothetical protein
MAYNDDDEVLGTANNASGTFVLLDAGRYGLKPKSIKTVPNNFFSKEPQYDSNGKEIKQNKEQYQITFNVFDPAGDPDAFLVDENGSDILMTEWYSKPDSGEFGKRSRTYRPFAALMGGTELADNQQITKKALLDGRALALVTQKTGQDGKTVRNKIARDSEDPYSPVTTARKFNTRTAVATANADGDAPF